MESFFQLIIAYDMFYYVKFTALFIKTKVIFERKPQYESGKDIYLSL